jgi:hypothetical protein
MEEPVETGALENRPVGLERVPDAARRQENDDAADQEGEEERQQRGEQALRSLEDPVALEQTRRSGLRLG